MTMTTQAGVYLRQSKDRSGEGLAVSRQREDCLKLCAERGWLPTEYQDNDVSAFAKKPRPAYTRMLADIEAGKLDAVVVWDLDRLHRRPIELESFIDLADRRGLALATVSRDTDLATPEGRMYGRMKGVVSRHEGEQKSKRQKRAGLQLAQSGQPHRAPRAFGYEPGGLALRADEAQALRAAYASLLAGSTLVSLCRDLTAKGFLTPAGRPFHHSGVRAILLNPRNAALRGYTTKGADGRNRTEIVGPAVWPSVVDEDTWRAARALLTDDARRKNRNASTARRWLLGGLALCGRCLEEGKVTTVKVSYRGDRNPDGSAVRVYRCRESGHLSRMADWVDWRVSERVIARLSRPDALDLLVDNQREDSADLRQEAATYRLRLDQLAEDFADGKIDAPQLHAGTERLKARLDSLEKRMANVDRAPVLADLVTADDVRAHWVSMDLDRQRAVINTLYTVILKPRSPGRFETPLESVEMVPKI